jgi:galactokinase
VAAPGRVNLIGEHVDYNDGFVLPMAIERHVVIAAASAGSPAARFHSVARDETVEIPCRGPIRPAVPAWANYLRGVMAGFARRHPLPTGLEALILADLPPGGGLSSSAALEVATCLLLETATGHTIGEEDRIRLCQQAEHEFAGVPCGIMDQFAVTRARADHLMLLDCRSLAVRFVPFTDPDVTILIIHSGVVHELGKGEYARRRVECDRAAQVLGLPSLRDARLEQVVQAGSQLTATEVKRALHVTTEIERTPQFAAAVETRDWRRAGQLMYASHASLRHDYEVSCAELDALVEIAQQLGEANGVYGSRLTGGGFGGCTVSLVRTSAVGEVRRVISEAYHRRTGIQPGVFVSRPAQGAMRMGLDGAPTR